MCGGIRTFLILRREAVAQVLKTHCPVRSASLAPSNHLTERSAGPLLGVCVWFGLILETFRSVSSFGDRQGVEVWYRTVSFQQVAGRIRGERGKSQKWEEFVLLPKNGYTKRKEGRTDLACPL